MDIQKDGYVGYGTTNPQTIIHIVQSNVTITLEDPRNDINSTANIEFKNGSGDQNSDWKLSSSNSFFNIASVSNNTCNILSLNSNGNIVVAKDIVIGGNIVKSGENIDISKIHTSNITSGALLVERGGTGLNILQPNQLIVGNGINPPIQSSNLFWNNTTNTLTTSNINALTFSGIGSNITRINANNIETGTINTLRLPVATTSSIGAIKKGDNINIADDGTISVNLAYYNGHSTINGDFVVNSNLIVHGTSTTLNTDVYTTERLELTYGGTANTTFTIKQTAVGNTNNILNVTNSSTSNVFNVSSGGNVGIGITNPTSKLHIMTIDTAATTTNLLDFRNAGNYGIYATSIPIGLRGNTLDFLARDYNNAATLQIRNILSLRPEGNVGIGITNPSELLHVNGIIKTEGTIISGTDILSSNHIYTTSSTGRLGIGINPNMPTSSHIHLHRNSANTEIKLQFTDGTTLSTATDGLALYKGSDQNGYLWNYENNALILGTNNIERLRILNNGNIGIFNTVPIAPLTIGNASLANNDGFIVLEKSTILSNTRQFRIGLNSAFDFTIGDYGAGNVAGTWVESFKLGYAAPANSLVINGSGNVDINNILKIGSIGGTTGTIKLQVYAAGPDGATCAIFKHPNDTQGIGIKFNEIYGTNANQDLKLSVSGTGILAFSTNGVERIRVTDNGNVGIGTNTGITERLVVSGNAQISGTISGNGSLITNINANNISSGTIDRSRLPLATSAGAVGAVKKGNNINIDEGTISVDLATYNGHSTINGDLVVNSNLIVHGTSTTLNTDVYTTERLEVTNSGTINSTLTIKQTAIGNANNILNVINSATSNVFNVSSTGNVGIGTTNPINRLHLHNTTANSDVSIRFTDATSGAGATNGFAIGENSTQKAYLWNYGNTDMLFATNNAERMTISSTGNIGIGTTLNTAGVLLDVNGIIESRTSVGANNTFYFKGVANSDLSRVTIAGQYSTGSAVNDTILRSTNKLVLQSGVGAASIIIDTANNVGIGITNPQTTLDINGNLLIRAFGNSGSGTKGIFFRPDFVTANLYNCSILTFDHNLNGSSDGLSINANDGVSFCSGSNARNERMRISENGNVGIGTINPQRLLHIQNNMRIGGSGPVIDFGDNMNVQIYRPFTNNELSFTTSGIDRFRITDNGLFFQSNVWHNCLNSNPRFNFASNSTTYLRGHGNNPIEFRNATDTPIFKISGTGILDAYSNINIPLGSKYKINGQDLAFNNLIGIIPSSNLPIAGTGTIGILGGIKVDGSSITIDSNGIISASSASGSKWALLGSDNIYKVSGNVGIGIDSNIDEKLIVNGNLKIINGSLLTSNIITSNIITSNITTNIVNAQTISGAGSNITNINANNISSGTIDSLRLPLATSAGAVGAVKKGNNINIDDGTISVDLAYYNGPSTINGDLVVNSNLVVHGTSTTLNTDVYTTERLEVTNGGIANSTLTINQAASGNTNNILNVINSASSNVFNVSSTGNVGIGTTTNTNGVLLDVNGTIESRTSIGANNTFYFKGVANSDINRVISAGQYSTGSLVNDMVIRSTNKLVLQSGVGSAGIVIDTANNVGIGYNFPANKLHISSGLTGSTGVNTIPIKISSGAYSDYGNNTSTLIGLSTESGAGVKCAIGHCRTAGYDVGSIVFLCNNSLNFTNVTMSDEKMRIDSGGNVGIGTTAPNYSLQIHKTATAQDVRIALTDGTSTGGVNRGFHFVKGSDNNGYLWNYENKDLLFGTNSAERMRILANGNINMGGTLTLPNDINAIYSGGGGRTYYFNNGGTIYWGYGSGDIHQFRNSANNAVFYISSSGVLTMGNNVWHRDLTGGERLYFSPNAQTYVKGYGSSPIEFRNGVDSTILKISSTGVLDTYNNINIPLGSKYKINGQDLAFNNLIGIIPSSNLPIAGTGIIGALGGVKVDGSSITIDADGRISASSASGSKWALLGSDNIYKVSGNVGIGIDSNIDEKLIVNGNLKIINGSLLTSNIITSNIITSNITTNIVNAQTISGAGSNITNIKAGNITSGTIDSLRLPLATSSVLGVVKKGNNINIVDGTISVDLLSYNGDSTINGNLVVNSNLIIHGTSTTLNTEVYTTERLEITNGGANSTFTIKQTAAGNTSNILNVINSSSTNIFNVSSGGNVGIGTTNPLKNLHILQTHNSGGIIDTTSLDITQADLIVSSISSHTAKKDSGIMFFANGSASTNISYGSGFINSGWATSGGSTAWNKSYIDFNTHSTNTTAWTTDMRIQGGNVGIGTTNPTQLLTLNNGNILLTGLWNSSSKYNIHCFNTDKRLEFDYTNGTGLFDNNRITFNVNNQQAMNILTNGNVGIGKTAGYKLDVNGDVNATDIRIGGISLNTTINTNNTNVSNYVTITSNILATDFVARNIILDNKINTNNTNVSNYVSTTSNILATDFIARNIVLDNKINTNNTNVSNYVTITSNILATDFVARNIVLDNKINTNNTNVSNYVSTTSNILATDFVARNIVLDNKINTTSNILLTDFVGRDAVLDTKIATTSNILNTDYIFRDAVLKADYMTRDENIYTLLSDEIITNRYTNAKVATYLANFDTKIINGFVGIGTTDPQSQLEIKGQYATLRIVDSDTGTLNPKIDLVRGTGLFGSDASADWRIENSQGLFKISRQLTSGNPDFLTCISIFGNGNIGFGTDVPQARFHGHALTTSTRVATKYTDGTTTAGLGRGFDVGKDGNQNAFLENWENTAMIFTTNATERMRILNNGDVGIGTNAVPFAKLHLHKDGASQDVRIQFTDGTTGTTANNGTIIGKLADGRGFLYNYENAELFFGTAGTQRMMITATGNVGIGTATAINNKLEVNGNINIPSGSTYKINSRDLAFSNLIGIVPPASLPIAGTGVPGTVGGVKVDGSSITITPAGIISASSASGSKWTLSGTDNIYKVSGNVGIGIDSNLDEKLIVNGNLKITNGSLLTSNIITNILNAQTISGAGSNITRINANNISDGTINSLRLPLATSSVLGVVKKGSNINIVDGAISVDLLSYNGDSTINGNLVVNSNLIIHGISTTLNTDVYTTERLEVTNGGANSTLTIKQTSAGNTNNILNVINSSAANVFNISSTGAVSTNNNNINAGTGTITAATFSGALSGNATTATNASGLTGNPNISVGAITGSGQINQITNNTNAGVSFSIKNNSTGNTAFTQIAAQNANGDHFTMFLNSSTRTLDGGANTATLRNDAGDLRLAAALQTPFIYLNKTSVNIGIGTETPANYLHLHKNAASQDIAISLTDTTTGATSTNGLVVRKDSNSIGYLWNYANSPLLLGTNNAERIKIAANGAVGIQASSGILTNNMASGSLVIGNSSQNYGGGTGGWTTNMTGLLMECLDSTEIAIHDAANAVHSFMYYSGGTFTIGRNMFWGAANVSMPGSLSVTGNVGIGKTAGYKLDVNGDVNATDIRIGGVSLNTTINTNNTNVSNYVSITSNNLINNVRTEFYTKNHIDSSNFIKSSELPTNIITQPILNTCNFIRTDAVTSNFWKNVKSTQNNTIYYGAPVKIGGSNTIDVGNNYILEVLGNVRIKGTITQGWIGDGSTSGDGGVLAPTIFGSGSEITNLNANNITLGTLPVTRGGIGTTALTATQLLVGAGTNPVTSFSGLTWVSGTNTLVATNITGAGSNITNINAANIATGTLPVTRGGIGATALTATQLLVGDGTNPVTSFSGLTWVSGTNTLVATNITGAGSNITNINANNITLGTIDSLRLPTATTSVLGGVKVDGTTITINSSTGVISGANMYVLPTATTSVLGGVRVDGTTITINSSTGVISGANTYVLPVATQAVLGGVKKGNNINIAGDGTISVDLLSYNGDSTINGNLVVNSNLIVHGTSTTLNTDVYTTERLEVTYGGTTNSAFTIRQTAAGNTNNIFNVINSTANVFNVTSAGNVIIGETRSSTFDDNTSFVFPDSTLYVRGPRTAGSTTNITFRGGLETNANGKVKLWLASDASHSSYIEHEHLGSGNTDLMFGTSSGNTLPVERMRIVNNGNVGIGTNNPTARLHVHNTTANSDVGIRFTDSTSGASATNGFAIGENSTQQAYLLNYGNTDMLFSTNSTERLRILANGNVGIGTNSALSSLHLHKNAITQDVRIILSDNTSTSAVNRGFQIGKDASSQGFIWNYENSPLHFATNATERLRIAANGNVGIGTNDPTTLLDVVSASPIVQIRTTAAGGGKIYFGNSSHGVGRGPSVGTILDANDVSLWTAGTGSVAFATNSTERFRIAANGSISTINNNLTAGTGTITAATFSGALSGNATTATNASGLTGTPNISVGTINTTGITNTGNWSWAPGANYLLNATANTHEWSFDLMNQNTYTGCYWQVWSDKTGLGTILACRGDTGFVGIGTNPSAYRLTVQGDIAASADVIAYYSDERLKDIKEYVKDVLPTLSKINVFKYNCNDLAASYGFDKSKNEIGLSAQEIKKYYPELVALAPFDTIRDEGSDINISKSGEDYLTLKYERLVPILLQGIKELKEENNLQQKEIDDLKQENNLQQKEIDDLKLRLTRLELLL